MTKNNKKQNKDSTPHVLADQLQTKLNLQKTVVENRISNMDKNNYDNADTAPASEIKSEFHNPYTFIDFPNKENAPDRIRSTLLTEAEITGAKNNRLTGIMDLEIKTLSPLLSIEPNPSEIIIDGKKYTPPYNEDILENGYHPVYKALSIGNDIIVPATGIRGALRNMITIITGGTLNYVDENLWLCQGRDTKLGPSKIKDVPKNVFIAEVIEPGNSQKEGKVKIGEVKLIPTEKLKKLFIKYDKRYEKYLPTNGKVCHFWVDNPDDPKTLKENYSEETQWKLKLSGKKVENSPQFKFTKNKNGINYYYINKKLKKSKIKEIKKIYTDDPVNINQISTQKDYKFKWELKKGSNGNYYVYGDGINREGCVLFNGKSEPITLSSSYWVEYQNRNRHGVKQNLKKGDLVWLEPEDIDCEEIKSENDIESIQWARFGRTGSSLMEVLKKHHKHITPDSSNDDGKVDIVSDLFGQIPDSTCKNAAGPFAARVRPHNLIFYDGKDYLEKGITLAPLLNPHPGCIAFYRKGDACSIDKNSPLKGYKVYRNTVERGGEAPWFYENQGIYEYKNDHLILKDKKQVVNKTVDLLKVGQTGKLKISFRDLTENELSILLAAFTVDWKLGGGKPFGLGHCRVTKIIIRDENGEEILDKPLSRKGEEIMDIPEQYKKWYAKYMSRIESYQAAQKPVKRLRYPRAVEANNNSIHRGGYIWFGRHATPKKNGKGFQNIKAKGVLNSQLNGKKYIASQPLPDFNKDDLNADLLYGYDCIGDRSGTTLNKLEQFDEEKHKKPYGKPNENTSQNRRTRERNRRER